MGADGEQQVTRAAVLAAVAAALAGCTRRRRAAPSPSGTAPSAVRTATGSPQPTASPGPSRPTAGASPTVTVSPSASPSASPSGSPSGSPVATPTATPTAQTEAAVGRALRREYALLAAYDEAIAGAPSLAAPLRVIRRHHQQHVERLVELLAGPAPRSTHPPRKRLPRETRGAAAAALRRLTAAEQTAAREGVSAIGSVPGPVAVVLGEIAGSETQHAVVLPRLARGGRR